MASERLSVVFFIVMVIAAAVQMQSIDAQKTHTLDWIIPTSPTAYTTFAASKTFTVGDTLVFNFTTGAHTAAQVTKAAYDNCTTTKPIAVWTTGPASVKLNSTGPHYYLCTVPSHCNPLGQKVAITVVAATATSPASAPSSTSTTPTGAPAPGSSSAPSDSTPSDYGYEGYGYAPGEYNNLAQKIGTAGCVLVGTIILLSVFFIYCCRKKTKHGSSLFSQNASSYSKDVDAFIKQYGSLIPKRYRYSTLKKVTNSFKEELGKGGYGKVYRGSLSDGRDVAVKVLNATKGNGEEFMNEVASIGRTSHVNVVTLLGFCYEGKRRALIYEFMPNGSLEKFIYGKTPSLEGQHLGWEKLYSIAVGIARGLEYLHRGCNTRILHFDIKPHNILLDENFRPKISDFGLAKMYSTNESIISSLLQARGTIGYIAPELTNRSFGQVSHKSDVYSYGMMILEMVGGRKNVNAGADHTSEIYYPRWLYKRIQSDDVLNLANEISAEENEIVRKMVIVGLWCIQIYPSQRPSISKVIEMLEGQTAALEIPPHPYLCSGPSSPSNSPKKMVFSSSSGTEPLHQHDS